MLQKNIINNIYTQPGPQSRAFSYLLSTVSLPFYLTLLNSLFSINSLSDICKGPVFPSVKPPFQLLNNFNFFLCLRRGKELAGSHLTMYAMGEATIFAGKSVQKHMPDIGITIHNTDTTAVFEQVFKEHFKNLHAYACSILKDSDDAEEMVQNVFYKLWEKKDKIGELQSVPAYLYRSVHNECMNFVKHEKVKMAYEAHAVHHGNIASRPEDNADTKQLEKRIGEALADLPEQCRTIFQMSRFEELKYREIADKMGLSVKTVENQMGKALKILRTKLADYISVIGLFLITLVN